MTDDVYVPEQPTPDLDELHQHAPTPAVPAVPVCIDKPVYVIVQPSKAGPAFNVPLVTTRFTKVVGPDLRRAVVHLTCTSNDWLYSRGSQGEGVRIAAGVILPVAHCDEIWAKATQSGDELGVITEIYGD